MRRHPVAFGVFCLAVAFVATVKYRGRHPAHAASHATTDIEEVAAAEPPRPIVPAPPVLHTDGEPPKPQPAEPIQKVATADFSDEDEPVVVSAQAAQSGTQSPIDAESLETAVNAVVPALNRCYREALARDSTLRGDITIDLTVSPQEGSEHALIEDASVDAEEFQAPLFEQCLLSAMLALKIPRPTARQYISYPFTLDPDGQ